MQKRFDWIYRIQQDSIRQKQRLIYIFKARISCFNPVNPVKYFLSSL